MRKLLILASLFALPAFAGDLNCEIEQTIRYVAQAPRARNNITTSLKKITHLSITPGTLFASNNYGITLPTGSLGGNDWSMVLPADGALAQKTVNVFHDGQAMVKQYLQKRKKKLNFVLDYYLKPSGEGKITLSRYELNRDELFSPLQERPGSAWSNETNFKKFDPSHLNGSESSLIKVAEGMGTRSKKKVTVYYRFDVDCK